MATATPRYEGQIICIRVFVQRLMVTLCIQLFSFFNRFSTLNIMALETIFSYIFHFVVLPLIITLPFSYDLSGKFRYYFKFFVFYTLIGVSFTLTILPCTDWRLFFRYRKILTCGVSSFVTRVLNIRWKISGFEHLNAHKPCVIVASQQSSIDIIGILKIWSHLEDNCVIITDNRLIFNPFNIIWWRENNDVSKTLSSQQVKNLIRRNTNIWIFFKKIHDLNSDTVFRLLIKEQMPIVPVIISDYYFLDNQLKIFDPGYLSVKILHPVSTKSHSVDDAPNLLQEVESTMTQSFLGLSKEVTPATLTELRQCYVF